MRGAQDCLILRQSEVQATSGPCGTQCSRWRRPVRSRCAARAAVAEAEGPMAQTPAATRREPP